MRPPFHVRLVRWLGLALDGLANALSRAVEPFERALGWLVGRTLVASERVDRVDGVVARLVTIVGAPLRGLAWLAGKLVPQGAREAGASVGEGLARGWFWLVHKAMQAAEWLNLDLLFRWLAWVAWPVWRPVAGVLGFLYAWIVTRDVRQAAWGVPALLLLVPPAALGVWTAVREENWEVPLYRAALEEATEANDMAKIQLYERKLAQLDVNTNLHTYNRALALEEEGKHEEADQLMRRLAPEEERGFPQAHFWIVQQLLKDDPTLQRDQRDKLITLHLRHLESYGISDPVFAFVRARMLMEQGELVAAADLLRPLASENAGAAFEVLRLDLASRRKPELERDARWVLEHITNLRQQETKLNGDHYKFWATAVEILGRSNQLLEVFDEWRANEPTSDEAAAGWRRAAKLHAERMAAGATASPTAVADLLLELGSEPREAAWAEQQIARLYWLRDESRLKTALPEQTLESLFSDPRTPPAMLDALGVHAAKAEEWQRATECFRRVVAAEPQRAASWNNLAWVRLRGEQAQRDAAAEKGETPRLDKRELEEALDAVNRALDMQPKEYRFRETRGQIFVKLSRWQDAINDLEYAVNGMPEEKTIHTAIAVAYRAVGEEQLAEVHAKRGKE